MPRPGGPARVLVVGDSLGCSVSVGLEPAGTPAITARQATIIGCGVVSDQVFDEEEPFPRGTENCPMVTPRLELDALDRFDPDVVLWVSTWERFNFVVGDHLVRTGTQEWKRELQRRLAVGYSRLTSRGAHVIFLTVAPPAPADLINGGRIVDAKFDWKFPLMNTELTRFVGTHPDARLIDVASEVCPHGAPCPARVNGFEPRGYDGVHFPPESSVWLGRFMLPQILSAAAQPRVVGVGAQVAARS
jgi:hypothetical protein